MATSINVSDIVSLSEVEHVLRRPDTFIGSIFRTPRNSFCLTQDEKGRPRLQACTVLQSEGEEQPLLEVLGNAGDNAKRSRKEYNMDPGIIEVTMTDRKVTVKNYGVSIPVAQDENGQWYPYRLFNDMRTGTNFDDKKERTYIGKNGYGAKLCNITSTEFYIECADLSHGAMFKGWWSNHKLNFQFTVEPYQGVGYTLISYTPDFAYFGVENYDTEAFQIYSAHCAELSFACKIPVVFNGHEFNLSSIYDYAGMFFNINKSNAISYSSPDGTYDICLVDTPGEAVCATFINGVIIKAGGVHIDAAYHIIVERLLAVMGKATDGVKITKTDVVNHVSVFLNCTINQPRFKGQMKDYYAGPPIKIDIPEEVMKGVKRWKLIEQIYLAIKQKQQNKLKKTDGKKKQRCNSERITDANFAGGPNSQQATAILTGGKFA